jgi:hypothetical protein
MPCSGRHPGDAVANGQQRSAGETVGSAAPPQPALNGETRAEVSRIMARSIDQGHLDQGDRTYLAQLVSARTGLPPDEAERRVTDTEKARPARARRKLPTGLPRAAPISPSGPSCRSRSAR